MSLPAEKDLRQKQKWWIKEIVHPETVAVPHGIIDANLQMHELVFIGNFVGAMELPALIGGGEHEEDGHADIHEGMKLMTDQLGATENDFAVLYSEVWVDPTTKLCYDTFAAGRRGVGLLTSTKDADGIIEFKKRRYWIDTDWQGSGT